MDEKKTFSVLDRYGTDVTAAEYVTNPAIGRDKQIKELVLILLTPEKSAILIGKPGIGKTAIVEGLAYRIQQDDVPEALKGYQIINIKTASLLGTMPDGESKVQIMIDELKTRDKLILFVDEIHMLIGATDSSSLDFANIFKEGLGRGSIKVIGATTTEEYERYILRDKAFTRRFQKVDVPEPTQPEVVEIMMGTLPKIEKTTGRKLKYTKFQQSQIMKFVVEITDEYKRVFAIGSRYPDISLTIMKQAFSYAVYDNREYVDIFDFKKAIENSKNIYPDIIRKELPKFDITFKDIISFEKGETTDLDIQLGVARENVPKKEVEEAPLLVPVVEPVQTVVTNNYMNKPRERMTLSNFSNMSIQPSVNEKYISSDSLDSAIFDSSINTIKKERIIEEEVVAPIVYDGPPKLEKGLDIIRYEEALKPVSIYDPQEDPNNPTKRGWTFIQSIDNKDANIDVHKNIESKIEVSQGEDKTEFADDFFEEN